jgi:hypothetical protein
MALTSSPSPYSAILVPLLTIAPGVVVVALAVALNWGR